MSVLVPLGIVGSLAKWRALGSNPGFALVDTRAHYMTPLDLDRRVLSRGESVGTLILGVAEAGGAPQSCASRVVLDITSKGPVVRWF